MTSKLFLALKAVLACLLFCGCDSFFARPDLSKREYIGKFFPMIAEGSNVDLQFHYKAGVGGYGTIAGISGDRIEVAKIIEEKMKGRDFERSDQEWSTLNLGFRIQEAFPQGSVPDWARIEDGERYQMSEMKDGEKGMEIFVNGDSTRAFFVEIGG